MALNEDQVHLVGTGRDLLMGAGTRFDVQDEFNPFTTQVRTPQSQDRPYEHGALVGAEWFAERAVPIRVIANGADRDVPSARRAIQDMSAAFAAVGATGEIAELHFRLNEDPDEYVLFGRPRGIDPDMRTLGLGYSYVSTAFVASDPRIYSGALTSQSTGLPLQQGGLTVPARARTTRFRLPGATGAYASTPDHASLDITGDVDLRADIDPQSWTPAADSTLVGKYDDSTNNRSYRLDLTTTGALRITVSVDGVAPLSMSSTVPVPPGTGRSWVRGTLDVNDGAGNRVTTFYTSTDGTTWTQLGAPVTTAGALTLFSGNATVSVGARDNGTRSPFAGVVYKAQVRSGIAGTIAANPDFTGLSTGSTSFTDSTGKTWTVNGNATLVGDTYRGGLTIPTTIPGVLAGGVLTLVNDGSTNTSLWARIDGPAPEPGLVLRRPDGTVQTLSFDLELTAGQWLEINTAAGTALLNGLVGSNQRGVADWGLDKYPIQPGPNRIRFTSAAYNSVATLTVEHRSAWW